MNERIKALRKRLGLTQQAFADRLKIARGNIGAYEVGKNAPSNAVISLICKEFNVNEIWLRTGEGGDDNMFTKVNEEDRFSINLGKLSRTENQMARNMLNAIAEADPEKLKHIEEFMKACLGIE
jgi:transcriptional regulator with XRE-family HTH domain